MKKVNCLKDLSNFNEVMRIGSLGRVLQGADFFQCTVFLDTKKTLRWHKLHIKFSIFHIYAGSHKVKVTQKPFNSGAQYQSGGRRAGTTRGCPERERERRTTTFQFSKIFIMLKCRLEANGAKRQSGNVPSKKMDSLPYPLPALSPSTLLSRSLHLSVFLSGLVKLCKSLGHCRATSSLSSFSLSLSVSHSQSRSLSSCSSLLSPPSLSVSLLSACLLLFVLLLVIFHAALCKLL